ncbi:MULTISPECIES: hypothetical protein [unclassified Bradyrhizobium]|jgi:hypothetical protein|uniref:hypothetical protein n=1 Tax=unclassified Bradyrhizobium TaxID=2631580 RepID=UPI00104CF394|nr:MULTISPECIES: hypothetical protein [unclassified Bradyrhizobium]
MPKATEDDPRETPLDDPRQQTDMSTHRQTNEPWRGNPEKHQTEPKRPRVDLERWHKSDAHQSLMRLRQSFIAL